MAGTEEAGLTPDGLGELIVHSSLGQPAPHPRSALPWLTPQAAAQAKTSWDQQLRVQADGSGEFSGLGGNTQQVPLQYVDPLFDPILMVFPQDNIRELNRRLRHYYKYEPYIRSTIDFHTETPISDFELVCPGNTEAQEYFNDFKDRVNLLDHLINICRDYWLLGEGFLYGNWDENEMEFSGFVQLPPEEVEVKSAYIMPERVHVLRPNKELQRLQHSNNPSDVRLNELMSEHSPLYAQALQEGKPFVLDSNRLIVLQRSMAGYSNRGISPVMAVLKDLLYEDYLILYRMIFIQRHSFPLKIFKLGSAEKGFIPPPRWYADFRRLLAQAANDANFNIVTHPLVQTEVITGYDKILPLDKQFEMVKSRIFAGLFVSDAIISGEKTPFASGITFMKGLMHRYLTFRNNLTNELKRKVFANLSRMREFYTPSEADVNHRIKTSKGRRLVIPEVYWQKANLLSNQAIMQMLITLREKKEVPMKYVAEMFGFDYNDMMHQLKNEMGTPADPVWQDLRKKVATDSKFKLHELGRRVLLGDDVVQALKDMEKAGIKTDTEAAADKEREEDFPLPPAPSAGLGPMEPEMPSRPVEAPMEIPTPGVPGEGRPKPGEATETAPAAETGGL